MVLNTTSKAYILASTITPTNSTTAVTTIADTGVYLDTTAGKLTATSFAGNGSALTNILASSVTGILGIEHGGTGATSTASAWANLGGKAVG